MSQDHLTMLDLHKYLPYIRVGGKKKIFFIVNNYGKYVIALY